MKLYPISIDVEFPKGFIIDENEEISRFISIKRVLKKENFYECTTYNKDNAAYKYARAFIKSLENRKHSVNPVFLCISY